MSKTILRHILIKKIFLTFLLTPYLYTFSLYENPSFIIFSAETEYMATRSWYRNKPETLSRNESGRFGALKSDSTHHFFRNACTKSGSLRFSQFSCCWLILSVYITCNTFLIRVITKLPNSEQSYKGKVKTHKYINRQNQSTTGKLWKP
jgi:hypothetical protein